MGMMKKQIYIHQVICTPYIVLEKHISLPRDLKIYIFLGASVNLAEIS